MFYTIITEMAYKGLHSNQRVIHNVDTNNIGKVLAVIYTGIDMDGSKEKMRMINFSSKLEGDDSGWADHVDEDLQN